MALRDPRSEQLEIREDTRKYFATPLFDKVGSAMNAVLSLIRYVFQGAKQHDLMVSSVKSFASLGASIEKQEKSMATLESAIKELHQTMLITEQSVAVLHELTATIPPQHLLSE
eukprot:ANDGO_06934.mRNA.1 hypothetical protein